MLLLLSELLLELEELLLLALADSEILVGLLAALESVTGMGGYDVSGFELLLSRRVSTCACE